MGLFDKLAKANQKMLEVGSKKRPDLDAGALHILSGTDGRLWLYEDKLVILRSGVVAATSLTAGNERTIPLSKVQACQFKEGTKLVNGHLQLSVVGSMGSGGNLVDIASDENALMFSYLYNDTAKAIHEFVQEAVMNQDSTQQTQDGGNISQADELLKFKQLLDSGVITQDEFDKKKQSLLGN